MCASVCVGMSAWLCMVKWVFVCVYMHAPPPTHPYTRYSHSPSHARRPDLAGTALRVLGSVYRTLLQTPGAAAALDGEEVRVSFECLCGRDLLGVCAV